MRVTIALPPLLSERAGGEAELEVEAESLAGALHSLTEKYPDLARLVWRGTGDMNPYVVLYLNGRRIDEGADLAQSLEEGDEIVLISALEGG